jgi:hypothetical protein
MRDLQASESSRSSPGRLYVPHSASAFFGFFFPPSPPSYLKYLKSSPDSALSRDSVLPSLAPRPHLLPKLIKTKEATPSVAHVVCALCIFSIICIESILPGHPPSAFSPSAYHRIVSSSIHLRPISLDHTPLSRTCDVDVSVPYDKAISHSFCRQHHALRRRTASASALICYSRYAFRLGWQGANYA